MAQPYEPPALVGLRDEFNAAYPHRDKTSDGTIGDLPHRQRSSRHNIEERGFVHAWDVDVDLGPGHDLNVEIERLRLRARAGLERRLALLIWRDRDCGPYSRWEWTPYQPDKPGRNRHTLHAHIEIHRTAAAEKDRSRWLATEPEPPPKKKDWFDMAEKVDLKDALREVLDEGKVHGLKPNGYAPSMFWIGETLRLIFNQQVAIAKKIGADIVERER